MSLSAPEVSCPSTPEVPFIPDHLNVSEALKALNVQKGLTRKILQVLGNDAPVPERQESTPSYFSSHVEELYQNQSLIFFRLEDDTTIPSRYHIYDHPTWCGWDAIWSAQPLELDPNRIPPPVPELDFPSALFRIEISAGYLRDGNGPLRIQQGTTLIFKGYDASRVRHIAEWCYQTRSQKAYIKMVGIAKNGNLLPYNHPRFPAFTLIVPTHFSCVPELPHTPPHVAEPRSLIVLYERLFSSFKRKAIPAHPDHGISPSTSTPAHDSVKKWTFVGNGRR
jgi:hypothetical protein